MQAPGDSARRESAAIARNSGRNVVELEPDARREKKEELPKGTGGNPTLVLNAGGTPQARGTSTVSGTVLKYTKYTLLGLISDHVKCQRSLAILVRKRV